MSLHPPPTRVIPVSILSQIFNGNVLIPYTLYYQVVVPITVM